jgi:transcriptional regulator with XRE-family HTH domain
MAKASRRKPERLAEKLLEIRQKLGLSQNGLIRRLGLTDELEQDYISKFERGVLVPPLHVLLAYAEAANVWVEALIKDSANLPEYCPALKSTRDCPGPLSRGKDSDHHRAQLPRV